MSVEDKTVDQALEYLKILQEGRVKPDKHGTHVFIRDSIDNAKSCEKLRNLLDQYFKKELDNG